MQEPHLANERCVLFEQLPILCAHNALDFLEVFLQFIEHAAQILLVLQAAIQLGEHLVGIVNRCQRLVGTSVG